MSNNTSEFLSARREVRATNSAKRKELANSLRLEGNDLYNKGNYLEAADNYAKAVNIHGPKPVLMSNLAMTYLKLELYEDAEWAATTALTYDPHNVKARFRRAMARKGMESRQAAMSDLQIIIDENPTCKEAGTEIQTLLEPGNDDAFFIDCEDFPVYREEPQELFSDSGTSECGHTGNGIPCRFHNREGCVRASRCKFSHAPDDKSTRDELGRNVCLGYLLDECRFGDRKCFYSHDRTYLPSGGWWNDQEKVAVKSALVLLEAESKQITPWRKQRGRRQKDVLLAHLKDSLERAAQKVQKETTSITVEPFVLLLSLENEDFFAEMHAHVLTALRNKLQVIQALTHEDALKHLTSPYLAGVFVTDVGIVQAEASTVVDKLVTYVKNGGSIMFAGCFSSFISPLDLNRFFKNIWGLDWMQGSYFRTTFTVNKSNEIAKKNPSLTTSYSMKAVHISHISPDMAIYGPSQDGHPTPTPLAESPAVCARVGRGLVSYLGDVNAETSSTNTMLAMLGLLDPPKEPSPLPPPPPLPPKAETTPKIDWSEDLPPKMRKNTLSTKTSSPTEKPSTPSRRLNDTPTTSTPPQSTGEKFILIMALKHKDGFVRIWKSQISALREKTQVHIADTTPSALTYLASSGLEGVYVADEGVLYPQILSKLVEYTRSGGTVVVGGLLPSTPGKSQIAALFSAFDLPWNKGTCLDEMSSDLFLDHDIARRYPSVPKSYSSKTVTLKGVDRDAVLYITGLDSDDDQSPDQLQAPILQTRVGAGTLGYIGDTKASPESTPILLAMLDILGRPSHIVPDTLKFVMVLSFSVVDLIEKHYDDFFQELQEKVEVLHGLSNARVIDLLSSPDLAGVFITDSSITDHKNRYLLSKLVEYSKNGGTIIFGALFCGNIAATDMLPFFFDNWGLSWELAGGRVNASVAPNPKNSLVTKESGLPASFYLSAHYLKGITQSMAVYAAQNKPYVWKPDRKIFQSAILYTGVQKGHVGYIGMKDLDQIFISIFCAMLRIP